MASRLIERLKKVEALFRPRPLAVPFVAEMLRGESADDALRRHADKYGCVPGRKQHVVLAPPQLTAAEWLSEFGWSDET